MKKKHPLYIITLTLLTLLLVKVSGAHVYSHDDCDSIENCALCEYAIENQDAEFVLPSPNYIAFVVAPIFVKEEIISGNTQNFSSSPLHYRLFGRPPPSQI